MYRNTYAKINETVLTENVRNIRDNYPDFKYYFGVVKGNAYGHGFHVVNALIAGGINYLAVATADEALAVREFNSDVPVLCLEPTVPEFWDKAAQLNISLTADSLQTYQKICETVTLPVKVHIKTDTGMNRLGFKDKEELNAVFRLPRNQNVTIEGLYTHFATGGTNDPYYDRQLARFCELTEDIDLEKIPIVHADRSLTMVRHDKSEFVNGVRLGICMYGFGQSTAEPTGLRKLKHDLLLKKQVISPCHFRNNLNLKTAFSLYSTVLAVKPVKKGEFVGYGAEYIAKTDMTVATLAIGYFDGMKNFGKVKISGKDCPILGELCMDMITVEVDSSVKVGDKVEIFGNEIPIRSAAADAGTNAYKVLTGITERVERIYET